MDMETLMAWLLRIAVISSAGVIIAGTVAAEIYGVQAGEYIIVAGIIMLTATPILRVALSVFAFATERDWLYVAITAIVFINLMVAVLLVPLLHP